jgi:hypothetical protein
MTLKTALKNSKCRDAKFEVTMEPTESSGRHKTRFEQNDAKLRDTIKRRHSWCICHRTGRKKYDAKRRDAESEVKMKPKEASGHHTTHF